MQKIFLITLLLVSLLPNARTLNVVNFGANGKDKIDDTKAFQKCVDQLASEGGGTMEIPNGIYHISHLTFFGKKYSNITIKGFNSTIRQILPAKRISAHNGLYQTFAERLSADGCFVFDAMVSHQQDDSESIKNIKISGVKFETDVQKVGFDELMHQISAHGVSNFSVDNCSFTGFLGDGVAINAGTDYRFNRNAYNKNITIYNCKFDGVNKDNRQGISIYYSDGFLIENCSFKNITRGDMPGAIDIEPNSETQVSRNGIIRNCSFENIGGLGAVTIHTGKSSSLNKYSNKNFIVENCNFQNVRAAFCIVGHEKFMEYKTSENVIRILNSKVRNAEAIADIRSGFGILFSNVQFYDIHNAGLNTVTDGGANGITFDQCLFDNVSNIYGVVFYGKTTNINFKNSTFKNFAAHAITINDPLGIGTITDNVFYSSKYGRALPLVTSTISRSEILSKLNIKNNQYFGTFKHIDLQEFLKK